MFGNENIPISDPFGSEESLPNVDTTLRYNDGEIDVVDRAYGGFSYVDTPHKTVHEASPTAKHNKRVAGILLPPLPITNLIVRDHRPPVATHTNRSMDRRMKAKGFVDPYQVKDRTGTTLDTEWEFVP